MRMENVRLGQVRIGLEVSERHNTPGGLALEDPWT